ncbi:hypothetical protein A2771_02625 [Candidatus Woesebacteria bacterium RIFCSPHIGHO2_01_FULL_38_26b]|uniref:Uncharacterized protein n=1 Tax=Candidatus Woesebacteria bacterium RIFCSPHIGHO2_01_FULL_38_26b TaxID=1802491 RepID=A0A1F7XVV9_9BACT|nr:MAG: hypothetical protein A2771_02625 [Candidatus Woesebacteria bacterium RIFCSPHIGHO2_01_FULL_38_26b]
MTAENIIDNSQIIIYQAEVNGGKINGTKPVLISPLETQMLRDYEEELANGLLSKDMGRGSIEKKEEKLEEYFGGGNG